MREGLGRVPRGRTLSAGPSLRGSPTQEDLGARAFPGRALCPKEKCHEARDCPLGGRVVFGCGEQLDSNEEPQQQESNLTLEPLDTCAMAAPNSIQYLNSGVTDLDSKSGSGAYAYDTSNLCHRWIVDFKSATYSLPVVLMASAFDLPSSSSYGGTVPGTAEDCARFTQYVTFYRRLANETAFTNQGGTTTKGSWSGGKCQLYVSSGSVKWVITKPSTSGWDTYRVAVSAKERSTYQEVHAYSYAYQEPPK